MNHAARIFTILSAICLLAIVSAGGQHRKYQNTTISTDDDKTVTDCEQVRIQIGDGETIRSMLEQSLPRSGAPSLSVQSQPRGGIHVQGWSGDSYSIKACLAAAGDNTAEARSVLDQIKLSAQDGVVKLDGPSGQNWIGFLLIQAPIGATLDLSSTNGPITVRAFSGTIKAHNVNGPITLSEVQGKIRADVQNGPIDVDRSGGDFNLNAQNGPLTIELSGNEWSGQLEGHTQNGPLTLRLPENFQSAVRVDASKHSPVECLAVQCRGAARTWDQPNVIRFGDSTPVVRLSTVNGPVTVTSSSR
jgi:hypothetical protein